MQSRWSFKRRSSWALVAAPVLALASMSVAAAAPATARVATGAPRAVAPHKISEVDCNGWSLKYKPVVAAHRETCVDPRGPKKLKGKWAAPASTYNSRGRFVDNGHYVGHDEPSVKFISSAGGSGNTMTYYMKMPKDPTKPPTNNGKVVKYAELSVAPWFGLPICDPKSYPQNPCTPDSDTNTGSGLPTDAGSAFMELQFYPPGFAPWLDSASCNATKWCTAINIDSLESEFNFVNLNPNCEEPVNFAYLTTNGKPGGPPAPQTANVHTFQPGKHTLFMNSGDVIKVAISDPPAGFTTVVSDLTTGQTGRMTASAGNGFMNTNYKTCAGTPFTFHAEYNTASQQNQVPWAALEGGVLMQQEIGHSEVCASLANKDPINEPGLIVDKNTHDTCVGGNEGRSHHRPAKGEGSCNPRTGVCKGATTEGTTGPIACPSNNFASGQLCEYADGICLPQGTRTVIVGGKAIRETSPVNLCGDNRFQNGDLDFDGMSYQPHTWPNGSPNVPTSFRYAGPFDKTGQTYPKIQFETDAPGSAFLCNIFNGNLCVTPPVGAKFYPFWTLTNKKGQNVGNGLFPTGACVWNFGNVISGVTTRNLGKAAQYGTPNVARFGGTVTSAVKANPEISGGCPALSQPKS